MIRWLTGEVGTAACDGCDVPADARVVDVRELVDREGNDTDVLLAHINHASTLLQAGCRVVICCDHGISRSNAIAIAVIARRRGQSFDAVLADLLVGAKPPEIRIELLSTVRTALESQLQPPHSDAMRVLITGAYGALGALLAMQPPAGVKVFAPPRSELDLSLGPAPIDLYFRRHGIDRVMHFAQPREVNTGGALGAALAMLHNLLDACVANETRVLFPSNWLLFAGYPDDELSADEDSVARPATCLGDTKLLCETLLAHYSLRYDLSIAVLRSGPVIGAGLAPRFVHTLYARARAGLPLFTHRYDNGGPALDMLAATDYATAAWRLIAGNACGTYHAGSSQLTSTAHIARLLVQATHSLSPLEQIPIHGHTCRVLLGGQRLHKQLGWSAKTTPNQALLEFTEQPEREVRASMDN